MGNAHLVATFDRVFEGLHALLLGCTVLRVKLYGDAREGNASFCHKPTNMIKVHVSDVDLVDLFRLATSRQGDTKKKCYAESSSEVATKDDHYRYWAIPTQSASARFSLAASNTAEGKNAQFLIVKYNTHSNPPALPCTLLGAQVQDP